MTALNQDYRADDYFYERAEMELKLAQAAAHPNAVRAHYMLAGYYLDRFYGDDEHVERQVLDAR